ncbi:MAG: heparinase II/III family protein [Lachnospiraceae bacterium]|nr:heparinase II/III family protein [Lachnospiraceae bacterium]
MTMTKAEFFSRGNEHFFFDDPAAVAKYCLEHWPGDCKHIIRIADEVSRNYFLFDMEHDMERTWEPVTFDPEGEVDWEYRPGNDPEFTFQFNRHRFFICLGQAYWLTGDEKYARHFIRLLMSWIHNIKRTPETEKTTWRILETGIRGENWVKAIRYFKDCPLLTDQMVDEFYRCLVEHAEYIIQMHSPYRYMSNWGVMENHGLFEIGIAVPDETLKKRYIQIALEHLEIESRMQILGDGIQWEQSPLYHNEVLHCYEDVLILASRNDIEVPDTILDAVRRMAYGNLAWKKPDHKQFLMGDSDDMDIRDYLSIAAYLYRDGMLKFGGFPILDFESVWDLGIESAGIYEKLEAREPDFTSIALSDSGNYYLRSGWEENASLLHFHCGTMGAGHGHSDKLHVDLVVNGEDVLTDAGRCTYVVDWGRFQFKDPSAHNTITVDGKDFTVCRDSWECSKLCQPVKGQYRFTGEYEFVQGGHLGYLMEDVSQETADGQHGDLDAAGNGTGAAKTAEAGSEASEAGIEAASGRDGVFVNRKIVHIKPDLYIIMDEMYAKGSHTYQQYWNFSETGTVSLSPVHPVKVPELPGLREAGNPDPTLHKDGKQADYSVEAIGTPAVQTAVFTGEKAEAKFFFLTPGAEGHLETSKIARHYNRYEERQRIKMEAAGCGFTSLLTVVQGGAKGERKDCQVVKLPVKSALKGIFYPASMAEALKITSDGKEYVVIICHQEVNSPTDLEEVDGCLGFGNVIVFDKAVDTKVGTVLNY